MSAPAEIRVRVAEAEAITPTIKRLKLVPVTGTPLPDFSGGAHTVVHYTDGPRHVRNPYSLMGSPFDASAYQISVLRVPDSRGGSALIHDAVHEGTEITITSPINLFPIDRRARRHILIAGGIGITPFMAMTAQLDREGADFQLHYAMRDRASGAYWQLLCTLYGHRVHTYFDDTNETLALSRLLDGQPLGTHLYVCGPAGMIDWVLKTAKEAGWPDENVHFERFAAPPPGKAFQVELAKSKRTIDVGARESVLEAIEAAGIEPQFLCRGGACGQCETAVLKADGSLLHNDHFLSDDEKASAKKMMICVSRFEGARLVLDL